MLTIKFLPLITLLLLATATVCTAQVDPKWEIHDRNRPMPTAVTPGTASTQEAPGKARSLRPLCESPCEYKG